MQEQELSEISLKFSFGPVGLEAGYAGGWPELAQSKHCLQERHDLAVEKNWERESRQPSGFDDVLADMLWEFCYGFAR